MCERKHDRKLNIKTVVCRDFFRCYESIILIAENANCLQVLKHRALTLMVIVTSLECFSNDASSTRNGLLCNVLMAAPTRFVTINYGVRIFT